MGGGDTPRKENEKKTAPERGNTGGLLYACSANLYEAFYDRGSP